LLRFFEEEVVLVYDKPVPGIPTVCLTLPWPKVVFAPRPPIVTLDPFLPMFHRTPGKIFTERRKRQGIFASPFYG
jgi:hypothetical protein